MLPWERPRFAYARDASGGTFLSGSTNTVGNPSAGTTTWTVSCWVNVDINNAAQTLICKWGTTTATRSYLLTINATGKVVLNIGDAAGNDGASGATTVSTGAWHHILGWKSGTGANALRVFLDGAQDGAATSNRTMQTSSSANSALRCGQQTGVGNNMDGRIAEIAMWEAALTTNQIAQLAKGVSPLLIGTTPRYYWPVWGVATPEAPMVQNPSGETGTLGAGSTVFANHAPVMRPVFFGAAA